MPTSRVSSLFFVLLTLAVFVCPRPLNHTIRLLDLTVFSQHEPVQAEATPTSIPGTQAAARGKPGVSGGNAVLICGAAILVMIIVGAILFVPRPPNHTDGS